MNLKKFSERYSLLFFFAVILLIVCSGWGYLNYQDEGPKNVGVVSVGENFTIELILTPSKKQLPNSVILGNIPGYNNFQGFILQHQDEFDDKYIFGFGDGEKWLPGVAFTLPVLQKSYLVISVEGSLISVYTNGNLVARSNAINRIEDSSTPLMVGNLAGSRLPFSGVISELKISSSPLNYSDVSFNYNRFKNIKKYTTPFFSDTNKIIHSNSSGANPFYRLENDYRIIPLLTLLFTEPDNLRWLALILLFFLIILLPEYNSNSNKILLLILLMVILYLLPMLIGYKNIGDNDWDQIQSTYQTVKLTLLKYHQLPWWNPYFCGGNVQFAFPLTSFMSPFFIIILLSDTVSSVKLVLFIYLIIGAVGCYLLSRQLKFTTLATLMFSLTFILSGYFAHRMSVGHVTFLATIYLSYILLFYWKSLENKKYIPFASTFVVLYVLEAHNFLVILLVLFLVFYPFFIVLSNLFKKHENLKKDSVDPDKDIKLTFNPLITIVIISALAFLLISFKAIPTLDYISGLTNTNRFSIDGLDLVLLKDALLSDTQDSAEPHHWLWQEYNSYIGWVALLLAIYGILISLRNRLLLSLFAFMIFIIIFSFNRSFPINVWDFFHNIPLFSSQHIPSRVLSYVVFILALFTGVGMKHIEACNKNLAKLTLIVVLFMLFYTNNNLIFDMFRMNPQTEYHNERGMFYQIEGAHDKMYPFIKEDIGVINCYTLPPFLPQKAQPLESQSYRGEVYLQREGKIEILEFTPNYITVKVTTTTDNILIVNQNYHYGWSANGKPADNTSGLVSTKLTPGQYMITFKYWPPGLTIGLIMTLIGVVIAIVLYKRCS